MPLTTTAVNGCDAAVWLDDVNGAPQDISGSSNSVAMDLTINTGEVNAFQNDWPTRLDCGKDATITLEVMYTEAAAEGWDVLKGWYFANTPGNRTFTFYLPDKNVGSDKFECEGRLESLSWTAEAGEATPILVTAVIRPNGELTHTDVAT